MNNPFDKYIRDANDPFGDLEYNGMDYTDSQYPSKELDLVCEKMGFCGCGMPGEAVKYVLGAFELLQKVRADEWKGNSWEEMNSYFGSDGQKYFFWYWADRNEFTDHGGSVPGWLSPKGEELLAELRWIRDNYDMDMRFRK